MYGSTVASSLCRKTAAFDLPLRRKRDKSYKIPGGKVVFTCFNSDFLLEDADEWRKECWQMIRRREDVYFYFFTKRIHRFEQCMPPDWGDGYENVPFRFHQTGAKLLKDGRIYRIPHRYQLLQAHKANIDFRIGEYFVPETADTSLWKDIP